MNVRDTVLPFASESTATVGSGLRRTWNCSYGVTGPGTRLLQLPKEEGRRLPAVGPLSAPRSHPRGLSLSAVRFRKDLPTGQSLSFSLVCVGSCDTRGPEACLSQANGE